ncbi:hypothetical protein ACFY1A_38910 [Streptomyces sp. NPDC001520]|uniref:hypothetical protein n=1 Tax=Streptomyces sp. NPDC001520 TaxID=3364581 RepID=UPI00368CE6B9
MRSPFSEGLAVGMGDEFVQQHQGLAVVAQKPDERPGRGREADSVRPAASKVAVPGSGCICEAVDRTGPGARVDGEAVAICRSSQGGPERRGWVSLSAAGR